MHATAAATPPRPLRRGGVLAVGLLVTLVALVDTLIAPWSPLILAHAALALLLPLAWGTWSFGRLSTVRRSSWALVIVVPIAFQIVASFWDGLLWPWIVRLAGVDPAVSQGPYYTLTAALPAVFQAGASRLGWPVDRMTWVYFSFIVLWAGLGEELFYRGYVYGTLRKRGVGAIRAAIVSSALFGVRHAAQLAPVHPYPLAAALSWVVIAFVIGLALAWIYERSASLWPPVLAHYLFNLIPFAALLFT
ncbi:MAG TPA: CPBP family intramembrane glutamic endopeptidase [Dongiaceae bacterium]|nr:CPBP family intramembrane glutamic endopeptidase [Dongiaceae bacterium]